MTAYLLLNYFEAVSTAQAQDTKYDIQATVGIAISVLYQHPLQDMIEKCPYFILLYLVPSSKTTIANENPQGMSP